MMYDIEQQETMSNCQNDCTNEHETDVGHRNECWNCAQCIFCLGLPFVYAIMILFSIWNHISNDRTTNLIVGIICGVCLCCHLGVTYEKYSQTRYV